MSVGMMGLVPWLKVRSVDSESTLDSDSTVDADSAVDADSTVDVDSTVDRGGDWTVPSVVITLLQDERS